MFKDVDYFAIFLASFMAFIFKDVAEVHPPSDSTHVMFWIILGKGLWMAFVYILTRCLYGVLNSFFVKENSNE
ncbi:TPA: hypothetical protein ROX91_001984 [Bacillus cereus]|nr:hypothetical protein [Bacillus cereus]